MAYPVASYFPKLSNKRHDFHKEIFKPNMYECFPVQRLYEAFFILRRNERHLIKKKYLVFM